MPRQKTIWTVLPNGFKQGAGPRVLKVSFFVSPRLSPDADQTTGTLGQFPNFVDWPATLRHLQLGVMVVADGLAPVSLRTTIVTDPSPDSAFWNALFSRSTIVRGHEVKVEREAFCYYDPREIEARLYRGYGDIVQKAPYRVSQSNELKDAFWDLYNALLPGPPTGRLIIDDGLRDWSALSPAERAQLHRNIGDNLLRHSEISFSSKLAEAHLVAGMLSKRADDPVALVPETSDPASAYAQFAAFHHRWPPPSQGAAQTIDPSEADVEEFHALLSALGEYPDLLRRLGLVIDAEISHDDRLQSLFGEPSKRVRAALTFSGSIQLGEVYTPATRYICDVRSAGAPLPFPVFVAAPRGASQAAQRAAPAHDLETVGGLLNLAIPRGDGTTASRFDLIQTDIDGAIFKVMNTVKAIVLEERRVEEERGLPVDTSKQVGAPVFRTSGISLVRTGRAHALVADTFKAEVHEAALQSGKIAEFDAEDLTRGYRIDIRRFPRNLAFEAGGSWLSLHKRIGTFVFAETACTRATDEGFIQPAIVQNLATGAASPDPNTMYIPETLFHWQGWSLAAPPPAKPADLLLPPESGAVAPAGSTALDIHFEPAPVSLPRLRYGDWYQVRARTVDLAGNGLSLDAADVVLDALAAHRFRLPILFEHRPQFFRYRRFEPISAPEVVPRAALSAGEALDNMVIRGAGAPESEGSARNLQCNRTSERHIVPPKATLAMVEAHGLLDGAFGPGGNPRHYYNLCKKENGTLNDKDVTNINTGSREPLPDVVVTDPVSGVATTVPNGIRFVPIQASGMGTGYTVHFEEQLRLPYLPDPLARGAAVFGLPGVLGNTTGQLDESGSLTWDGDQVLDIEAISALGPLTKIDFGPADREPFRLRLEEAREDRPLLPEWDKTQRVLTVRLAPGETRPIWIASYPANTDVELLGLHAWWSKQEIDSGHNTPSDDKYHFLNMAQHGALAMLTPARKVTLVHAVQRPVKPPIESSEIEFKSIRFPGDTVAYLAGAFKIHPESTAKLDLLAKWQEPEPDGPRTINTHVFEVPIHLGGTTTSEPTGNTVPVASFDPDTKIVKLQSPSERMKPTDKKYLARHEFGDTKHRKITYRLVATTRYREYFPEEITRDPEKLVTTFKKELIIRSSAKPAPPEISHIVPTFGWSTKSDGGGVTSERRGGGLRVYLGSTWHSSGAGEQLAVVEDVDRDRNQWGLDPLRASSSATPQPIKPDVGAATPQPPGSWYDGKIHPYDVHYDAQQKLWYSDISFKVGSAYFPFRQLVLARYQENSLKGLHLSDSVHAGLHQLAPGRLLVLTYSAPGAGLRGWRRVASSLTQARRRKVSITLSALGASAAPAGVAAAEPPYRTEWELTIEERDAARKDWDRDLGWVPAQPSERPVAEQPTTEEQLWVGHVLLPASPGTKERRLVVREYEVFRPNATPTGQAWKGDAPGSARRMVYADAIMLDWQ